MKPLVLHTIQQNEARFFAEQLIKLTPWKELAYQSSTLENYFLGNTAGFECYVIKQQDQSAGVITLRTPWLRGILLELIAILPTFQAQGMGQWVIEQLQLKATQQKQRNLWTLVSGFNLPAQQFYGSQGFKQCGQLDDFIQAGEAELLLRKML